MEIKPTHAAMRQLNLMASMTRKKATMQSRDQTRKKIIFLNKIA